MGHPAHPDFSTNTSTEKNSGKLQSTVIRATKPEKLTSRYHRDQPTPEKKLNQYLHPRLLPSWYCAANWAVKTEKPRERQFKTEKLLE